MFHSKLNNIFDKLAAGKRIRLLAVGSSNTQRRQPGMHWLDYLELGLKYRFGKGAVIVINSGVGGDTSRGVLERFDTDVKLFRPDITILTVGGNDAAPKMDISPEEYKDNITDICKRILDMRSIPVLQTYYSCDLDKVEINNLVEARQFPQYMNIMREVASRMDLPLIDHLKRWEPLRLNDLEKYRKLMNDPFHVNSIGNMLIGVDLLRKFDLDISPFENYCREGVEYQAILDKLQ